MAAITGSTPSPRQSSKVVCVRLDTETITRLGRLAERTSRSRGFYLRAVIQTMLSTLEETYWTQQASIYEGSVIDRQFRTIMERVLRPDDGDSDPNRQE